MTSKNLVSSTSLKLLFVFLVAALALASLPSGQAQLGYPLVGPINPANPSTGHNQIPSDWEHDRYFITDNGVHWLIGDNLEHLRYSASLDGGLTWSNFILAEPYAHSGYSGHMTVAVRGNTVHNVGVEEGLNAGLFYSRLSASAGGVLTTTILDNLVEAGVNYQSGNTQGMTVDDSGRVIITQWNCAADTIKMYRSSDGLSWDSLEVNHGIVGDITLAEVMVYQGYNDTIRVVFCWDASAGSDKTVTTWTHDNGASWDASGINNLITVDTNAVLGELATAVDYSGNLHIIYIDEVTRQEKHAIVNFGDVIQNEIIKNAANNSRIRLRAYGFGSLFYVRNNADTRHYWYRTYVDGVWSEKTLIHYDATEDYPQLCVAKFLPETENFKVILRNATVGDGNLPLLWYPDIDFGPGDAEAPLGEPPVAPAWGGGDQAPSIAYPDMEGWLFEYEDYHLTAVTEWVNETLSWSFQLKGGNWNATYNRTSGAVTATSSEDIEVVKVTTTGADASLAWDFHILLTQNIADQLDVPVYVQATGPFGNLDWTLVSVVNIYNEGGLTNYSFVGWSGHETGDHPFEVFSADTRTPTLIDRYNFDVRSEPLTVAQDESELLGELRADWLIVMPYRDTDADIYPTHRLASYADPSDRGYVSYPFSLYIKDQAVDAGRILYMEKEFRRVIQTSHEELVTVEWYAMNPDVDQQAGQYRIQTQSIARYGSANMAVQMRFDSTNELDVWNVSGGGTWDTLISVTDYDWYKLRCELNMTSQTVDFYVGDVFQASAPFAQTCNKLGAFFMGTINSVTTLNRFYTDDVWAFTDFDLALGGIADVSQTYRKLQSWNMHLGYGIEAPDGVRDAAMGEGYIEFGVDYVFGNTWVPELSVRITPNATDLNARNNWIKYKVEWNHTATGQVIKTDYIFGLYEADTKLGVDFLQRELTSLFADLWVDQANSSSIVGGRVNVEWYGISDKAPWYQFWGQEWKPKITDIDRSQILMPLMDENGTIRQAFEIRLCRIWARSYRSDFGTFHHKITQISQFETNEVLGFNRFEGQDTPYFNQPKTPAMSNAGLFGPVYALIGAIGRTIVTALISGANGFIGLADSLLAFLGIDPGFFHSIVAFLGLIPNYIINLMVMVGTALDQLLGVITPLFEFVVFIMTFGLVFLGQLISKQLEFWRLVVDIFQGGVGMPFNFWVDFNLQAVLTLALVMLPWTIYNRWSEAQNPMATAQADISFAMTVAEFILGLYGTIIEILTNLVDLILQLIPT